MTRHGTRVIATAETDRSSGACCPSSCTKMQGGSNVFSNFWVPMINCFEGGTSGNNQNFSSLDSWPAAGSRVAMSMVNCRPSWESHSLAPQALHTLHLCCCGLSGRLLFADYGESNLRWRGQGKPHKDE